MVIIYSMDIVCLVQSVLEKRRVARGSWICVPVIEVREIQTLMGVGYRRSSNPPMSMIQSLREGLLPPGSACSVASFSMAWDLCSLCPHREWGPYSLWGSVLFGGSLFSMGSLFSIESLFYLFILFGGLCSVVRFLFCCKGLCSLWGSLYGVSVLLWGLCSHPSLTCKNFTLCIYLGSQWFICFSLGLVCGEELVWGGVLWVHHCWLK